MAKKRFSTRERNQIARRARGCCEYCLSQEAFSPQTFSIEHIAPRTAGGSDEPDNLALSCQGCNAHKHVKTHAPDPFDLSPAPLYHPRHDRWDDHFTWSADFTEIVGLTPSGRATVEALRLNRPNLKTLRAALFRLGEHPPK